MSRGTVILFIWLIIGAAAAGQRGYFSGAVKLGCSAGGTIALTIAAGPLNYLGVDPAVSCGWPQPSR